MTIIVDYRFPPAINAEKQAKTIAIGQTAGTWSERHSHRQEQLQQHLAEVVGIREEADGYKVARVRFPQINVENDIASLLTMIFGKYSMAGAGKV
ncbi:MAG: 2,3-diketo-5-methylthiopentyl-1-phosphate enolase, partial [Microcystis sp.]